MRKLTKKEEIARKRLCLPLDGLNSLQEIKETVEELSPFVGLFKIGKETFTRFGPESVKIVQSAGADVFLDLKYHDIPNTVKGASRAAAELGVYMFNVHASGGIEMMKSAVEGASGAKTAKTGKRPKIVAVTILTSIDKDIMNGQLNIQGDVEDEVLRLAKLAQKAGLDGIVCSAQELSMIKPKFPANFIFVTPGIQGPNTPAGSDQKRIATPGNAIKDGATILVVGRAVTGAKDRIKAGLEVLEDIARVL